MITLFDTSEWLRMGSVYCHLIICALAISAVLKADIDIMAGRYTPGALHKTASTIAVMLVALWATGLAIVYLDTGFTPDALLAKPKLILKLLCVLALTANGLVLHKLSFPLLTREQGALTVPEAIFLVVTGAISTSHWMLAAFIGLSQPLNQLPVTVLLPAYGLFFICVLVTSLFAVPLLLTKYNLYTDNAGLNKNN